VLDDRFKAAGLKPKGELPSDEWKRDAKVWSKLRDLTKRAEYCGIYGGTAATVYSSVVKDFPEVELAGLQRVIDAVNGQMRGVVAWRRKQEYLAGRTGETREALLGRARFWPLAPSYDRNVVYNFPIQAAAAVLMAKAILRFAVATKPHLVDIDTLPKASRPESEFIDAWNGRGPASLILNGHDSLVAECDAADADACRDLLGRAMTQSLTMSTGQAIVFAVDGPDIAQNWRAL
jgi:hypothetical protein